MSDREDLLKQLAPVVEAVRGLDLRDPDGACAQLEARLPFSSAAIQAVGATLREGVAAGWLCERENQGVRFGRVLKAQGDGVSIDAVHMRGDGAGHTHPGGEVDLCFAVDGDPRFCGRPAGWTVYPPGSWHVPAVQGGAMDILYFLPGGAIVFGPKPSS